MLIATALLAAAASTQQVRDLIAADRWKEALAEAQQLAQDQPGPEATTVLGEALYRAGKIDEAAEALAPLAATEGAPPRALAQLGLARAAQGKGEEARGLLERAAMEAPDDPWILLRAAGASATRARAVEVLEAYLAHGEGEDKERLEGARGTVRLYRALGERKVWIPVARPPRVVLPLKPIVGGAGYFVEMLAEKKKVRLLLDSGSSGVFVVERAVKKAGYAPLSEETVFAGGGEGRAASVRGVISRVAFGGVVFSDALVTTTQDEFDSQGRIHGVLGLSVFSGYRITIDLAAGRLVLETADDTPSGSPYWNVEGQMLVRVRAGDGADGLFLFDTGAFRSMIDTGFAATVPGAKLGAPAGVRTYGGNVADAQVASGIPLSFQSLPRASGPFNASSLSKRSRLGGVEVSGFLGMDLLAACTIVVDTRSQRVEVTPAARRR